MSAQPELRYLVGSAWKRYGRADIAAAGSTGGSSARDSLVLGSYIPGYTTDSVGLINPGATFTSVNGDANGEIYIDTPGTFTDRKYWGKVICRGSSDFTFHNCVFYGQKPEVTITVNGGAIQNYGSNPPHVNLWDCVIDRQGWYDSTDGVHTSLYKGSPWSSGIHGGNFSAYRCDIVHCQDGVNYVGPSTLAAADAAFCLMQGCWIHANYYKNGWYDQLAPFNGTEPADPGVPTSRDSHSDVFQFNTGHNITLRYNLLGGTRDMANYLLTPPNGFNGGQDAHNSAIMIQQESDTSDSARVGNVLIEYNWLGGGAATINENYKLGNAGSDWTFQYNKLMLRGASAPGGSGYSIYKHGSCTSIYTGNVNWDPAGSINGTGTAAPVALYPGT